MQDMYRKALAASWAAQPGELQADECIEDIFAGGDGWGDREKPYHSSLQVTGDSSGSHSEGEPRTLPLNAASNLDLKTDNKRESHGSGAGGRTGLEPQATQIRARAGRHKTRHKNEIDELEYREDLRSWRSPAA